MRLIDSYSLEFCEFEGGSSPPYAILSHTWGGEEILYKDMLWIQDYRRTYESDSLSTNEKGKSPDAGVGNGAGDGASGSRLPARSLPGGDEECPPYEEVEQTSTEDQATARVLRARHGYQKILKIAEHCRVSQIGFFWIDTCCIDKSNGMEVSEAILSAYRWYREAAVCFVYLADVPAADMLADRDSVFRRSWWFTRGWTLVELLAPTARVWFDQDWNFIFPDSRLISEITGIDAGYLEGADINLACVAKRMSWAAHRNTTKREDVAYCLMGLFDVSMSVRYGEGPEKAFIRLQRKILKATVDTSIFAWGYDAPILGDSARILATSPDEFAGCRALRRAPSTSPMNDYFLPGPRGLELRSDLVQFRARDTKVWEGQYGLLMTEIYDDAASDNRIFLPLGGIGAPNLSQDDSRILLHRFAGSRPIRIAPRARVRLNVVPRRSFYLRSDEPDPKHVVTVLFSPTLSTFPFNLVEVFPPNALVPSAGGIIAPRVVLPNTPNLVFFRYEEHSAGPTQPHRRRFVVVLEYRGKRDRSVFEITSSAVHVLNVTNSNLVSFCDEFVSHPDKTKPQHWSRFLSSVPVGDTLVSASVDVDSQRWDLMRLHVKTTPLGSVADGVVSGDELVAMVGARPEGERLATPFD
ncbi:hypothetical protein VUR80DRAFT_7510 [Thermomyces stellatus]